MQLKRFWNVVSEHYWVLWAILELWDEDCLRDLLIDGSILGRDLDPKAVISTIKHIRFHPGKILDRGMMHSASRVDSDRKDISKTLFYRTESYRQFAVLFHTSLEKGVARSSKCTQGAWIPGGVSVQGGIDELALIEKVLTKKRAGARLMVDAVMAKTEINLQCHTRKKGSAFITDFNKARKAGLPLRERAVQYDFYIFDPPLSVFVPKRP